MTVSQGRLRGGPFVFGTGRLRDKPRVDDLTRDKPIDQFPAAKNLLSRFIVKVKAQLCAALPPQTPNCNGQKRDDCSKNSVNRCHSKHSADGIVAISAKDLSGRRCRHPARRPGDLGTAVQASRRSFGGRGPRLPANNRGFRNRRADSGPNGRHAAAPFAKSLGEGALGQGQGHARPARGVDRSATGYGREKTNAQAENAATTLVQTPAANRFPAGSGRIGGGLAAHPKISHHFAGIVCIKTSSRPGLIFTSFQRAHSLIGSAQRSSADEIKPAARWIAALAAGNNPA